MNDGLDALAATEGRRSDKRTMLMPPPQAEVRRPWRGGMLAVGEYRTWSRSFTSQSPRSSIEWHSTQRPL
jgi:hypothetical protein